MHESSLTRDLIVKAESIAREQNAIKITGLSISIGILRQVSAEHFREHFELAARGTMAEGAKLDIEMVSDLDNPLAGEIVLKSVDVE